MVSGVGAVWPMAGRAWRTAWSASFLLKMMAWVALTSLARMRIPIATSYIMRLCILTWSAGRYELVHSRALQPVLGGFAFCAEM